MHIHVQYNNPNRTESQSTFKKCFTITIHHFTVPAIDERTSHQQQFNCSTVVLLKIGIASWYPMCACMFSVLWSMFSKLLHKNHTYSKSIPFAQYQIRWMNATYVPLSSSSSSFAFKTKIIRFNATDFLFSLSKTTNKTDR